MGTILHDLRYGARMLGKSPGFTAVAVLTLALGIGANSAIFSLLDAALLRSLPYPDAHALAKIHLTARADSESEVEVQPWWSYPKFEQLRDGASMFAGVAAYASSYYNLTGVSRPERLAVETVSANYFSILGVDAALGRTFLGEEDAVAGARPVVLLGYGIWQDRYGGDPNVLGQAIRLGETSLEIVGVMPRGFAGLSGVAQLWAPMAMAPALSRWDKALTWYGTHWHEIIARVRPGRPFAQAAAQIETLGRRVGESFPGPRKVYGAVAVPLESLRVDPVMKRSLLVLLAAVAMVLVIGCVNIAGLLLARAGARQRELSIRLAVGATRARLVRQLLTESLLLASLGGAVALLLAAWATGALTGLVPMAENYLFDIRSATIGWRVLLFTMTTSLLTGVAFGIAPALHASRGGIIEALKRGGAGTAAAGAAHRRSSRSVRLSLRRILTPRTVPSFRRLISPRSLLVAGQMALAIVLLVGAGLMLRSLAHLRAVDPGFTAGNVLSLRVEPDLAEPRGPNGLAFKRQLLERLAAVPGVDSVGLSNCAPLSGECWSTNIKEVDGIERSGSGEPYIGIQYVAPDHFATLGIPLLRGRSFGRADRAGAPLVMMINETAARELWPGEDPIGKRLSIGEPLFTDGGAAEIVGVVADVLYGTPREKAGLDAYMPALQGGPPRLMAFVRTSLEPASLTGALRAAVLALDPDLPIYDVQTMSERLAVATARSRFAGLLLGTLAGIALLLAVIGLYGVVSFGVSRRAREFGIRMALGARAANLLRGVVGSALLVAGVGIAAGIIAAVAATRVLASLLYEVSPTDLPTFLGVALLLTSVAAIAAYLPARRAARADPTVVLREE